jgi:hypothetical protein
MADQDSVERSQANGRRTQAPTCSVTLCGQRYSANPPHGYSIDNEHCEGQAIFLVKPCDGGDGSSKYANYFRGKKRLFEIQFQLRFKKRPHGTLWYGVELDTPLKLTPTKRAFIHAILAIVKAMQRKSFHFVVEGESTRTDGMYEKSHTALTLEGSVDNIVVTHPGEVPPKLGGAIPTEGAIPTDFATKLIRKTRSIDWNTVDTYT